MSQGGTVAEQREYQPPKSRLVCRKNSSQNGESVDGYHPLCVPAALVCIFRLTQPLWSEEMIGNGPGVLVPTMPLRSQIELGTRRPCLFRPVHPVLVPGTRVYRVGTKFPHLSSHYPPYSQLGHNAGSKIDSPLAHALFAAARDGQPDERVLVMRNFVFYSGTYKDI